MTRDNLVVDSSIFKSLPLSKSQSIREYRVMQFSISLMEQDKKLIAFPVSRKVKGFDC